MKKFSFLAGLPRSGSSLISSILNQNPNIYASSNSPMCGMAFNLERSIILSEQYNAFPKPKVLPNVISGLLENYYSDIDRPFIIDKSREWPIKEHFEVLLRNLSYEPKVILSVRNILDVLTSFITLINKNPNKENFIDREIQARQEFNFYRDINDIRCDHLMRPKGIIDNSLYGIAFAMLPENKKYFHIVEYDNLVYDTKNTIDKIYNFLELQKYDHDFNNIINITPEDDTIYGLDNMHEVRKNILKVSLRPEQVLSPYILNKYSGLEFWRNNG